jgi:hypothetical protein
LIKDDKTRNIRKESKKIKKNEGWRRAMIKNKRNACWADSNKEGKKGEKN